MAVDSSSMEMDRRSQIRLLVIGGVLSFTSIFQMGYATAYPNTSIDTFRDFLNVTTKEYGLELTDAKFSWLWSALLDTWFIGFSIGSCLSPIIADRIGRKSGLLVGNIANTISALISFLGILFNSIIAFTLSRLFFSLSAAISMNSLILLLQESSPVSMRGLMSFYAEMAFVVTNLVGGMAGMRSLLGTNLHLLTGVAVIVSALSVLVVIPVAESPIFLLEKRNDREKAEKATYFYQRIKPNKENKTQLEESNEREGNGSLKELLSTPHLRKGFLLGLCALQIAVSIWPIVFFSTEFLRRTGIDGELSELISTIMLFVSTLCTCVGMILVEKIARRTLLISTACVNLGALLLFVISAELTPIYQSANIGCIVAVMMHGGSYSVGLGPIAWFLISELMPLRVRAIAQSLALATNQTIALLLVAITLPLYDQIGAWTILILFVFPGVLCFFIIWRHLPETRARSIDEVIQSLKGAPRDFVAVELASPRKQ
ncbi:unnamed protein product, partial [Mesorhabditis belari]|uniref:Major facilitator superfamily (MFS) profile domain-containing protein n=1 Tax=Mesorhabditis belari TaxID=2138241 RepID=A0AAF3JBA1_9BILA